MITCESTNEYFVKCKCSNCGGITSWVQNGTPSKKDLLNHNFYRNEDLCRMCHILKINNEWHMMSYIKNKNKGE